MRIKYTPNFNNKLLIKPEKPGLKLSKIKAVTWKLKDKTTRH